MNINTKGQEGICVASAANLGNYYDLTQQNRGYCKVPAHYCGPCTGSGTGCYCAY
jgi:hypothetical protein